MARSLTVARKFWLAYVALAALLGGAIGLFVLGVEKPGPQPPPPWSTWIPKGATAAERQAQIASYVASRYHLPSGHQLVRVLVGGPDGGTTPIAAIAVAQVTNPRSANDFNVSRADGTAMYSLCGDVSAQCAIREGKASTARASVLRREALELALYTFRYVDGATSVVAFFPPKLGDNPTYALYFSKKQLGDELHRPLQKTLPQVVPPVPGRMTAVEQETINELTTPRVYRYALQTENGQHILVLAPVIG